MTHVSGSCLAFVVMKWNGFGHVTMLYLGVKHVAASQTTWSLHHRRCTKSIEIYSRLFRTMGSASVHDGVEFLAPGRAITVLQQQLISRIIADDHFSDGVPGQRLANGL